MTTRIIGIFALVFVVAACSSAPRPAITSVTIDQGAFSLEVGESTPLTATVVAVGGASQVVTWSISPPAIGTVHPATGVVTAVAPGDAVVTATSAFDVSKSGTVDLTVVEVPTTLLVSAADGSMTPANDWGESPSISVDGRHVAFHSEADNLVMGVSGRQVYLRDTQTNTTLLVSAADGSMTPGNDWSESPSISVDGRYVAFHSVADNLVTGVTGAQVYLRDTQTNTTLLVSAADSSMTPGSYMSREPSISADGRHVAFHSEADNLVTGVSGYQVYLRDTQTNTTLLVSAADGSMTPGNDWSFSSSISANGRHVAFNSNADDLVTGVSGPQVYLRDTQTDTTLLVSAADGSMTPGNNSWSYYSPSISAGGRFVAFDSMADDLVMGVSGRQVYLRDTQTDTTLLVSAADGSMTPGNSGSSSSSISADGRYVALGSDADNLVTGVSGYQVYLRDTQTDTTLLVSAADGGMTPGNEWSFSPSISADGRSVAFRSAADNLVSGVSGWQVYIRTR